jgi:ribonuclease J
VLITEGTNVGREAYEEVAEDQVLANCLSAAEEARGLVVADFSARNFERLETFAEIARKTGRRILVTAKDAYMLHAIGCAEGTCAMDADPIGVYAELKSRDRIKWEKEVVEARWSDRYVDHLDIKRNPEGFILCFSLFDLKHLLDVRPSGGVYIYSSSEAHSEEQEYDFLRLDQWLRHFNLKPVGYELQGDPPKPRFVKGFHASGHLSQADLTRVIEEIDPDTIIPIHTMHPEWFSSKFDEVIKVEEGAAYDL